MTQLQHAGQRAISPNLTEFRWPPPIGRIRADSKGLGRIRAATTDFGRIRADEADLGRIRAATTDFN
jgi:hypothetical protein